MRIVGSLVEDTPVPYGLGYVLVFVLALMLGLPTLRYGFVQDDHMLVEENPSIRSWEFFPSILMEDYFYRDGFKGKVGYYRPLTRLSFLIDYSIWNLSSFGFHLSNVVLSALTVCLALRVSSRVFPRSMGLLVAFLYACHPGRVQALAIITARSDLFAGLFGFWAVSLWIDRANGRKRRWVVSLLLFLALLGKESGIAFIAVLALWSFCGVRSSPSWKNASTWFALLSPLGVYFALRSLSGIVTPHASWGTVDSALETAGRLFSFYLRDVLLPIRNVTAPHLTQPDGLWRLGLLVCFVMILAPCIPKARFGLGEGSSWLAVSLLPLVIPGTIRNPVIEGYLSPSPRFLYIPAFGAAMIWGSTLHWICLRYRSARRALVLIGLLGCLILTVGFLDRLTVLSSDVRIGDAALRDLQRTSQHEWSPSLHASILRHEASSLAADGFYSEAAAKLESAQRIDHRHLGQRVNLAWLWRHAGRDSLAIDILVKSLDPDALRDFSRDDFMRNYENGILILIELLRERGRMDEAIQWIADLLDRFPASWKGRLEMARCELDSGDSLAALETYAHALQLSPSASDRREITEEMHRVRRMSNADP